VDARTTYDTLFIDGAWQPSPKGAVRPVVNPATAEVIGQVPDGDAADADAAMAAARRAFDDGPWPRLDRRDRAARLTRFLDVLAAHRSDLCSIVMQEAGALRQVADAYHLDLAFARFEGDRPCPPRPGYYYEPTVITGVQPDMRVAQEEIFGPVAAVIAFDTDDEAVQIANNSRYGLSGAIYSRDVGAAYEMARRLRTGQVRINGGGTAPDLDAPMAGWKASGMGAEYALPGLLEFTQLKSVGFKAG
jgi:acyl-CoA reductase-like NAD-dependent aldehyde dehydrogenase